MLLQVKDTKTGRERQVTEKAFKLQNPRFPRYELLAYLDSDGNEVDAPPTQIQKKRLVEKVVPPVEGRKAKLTVEEIDEKKREIAAMNQAALDKAQEEAELKKTKNAKV
jgi:hypothetical protein